LSVSHSDSETGAPVPNPVSAARPTLLILSIMFDSAVMLDTRAPTVSSILDEHKIGATYECFVLTKRRKTYIPAKCRVTWYVRTEGVDERLSFVWRPPHIHDE
jgi:hypothetical protein